MYMEFFFKYINSIEKNFSPRETHSKTDSIFPFESIKHIYIYIYETYLIIYLNFLPPTNIQQLSPFSLQSKQRSPLLGERKEKETAESILLISLITMDKCKTKEKEAYYYYLAESVSLRRSFSTRRRLTPWESPRGIDVWRNAGGMARNPFHPATLPRNPYSRPASLASSLALQRGQWRCDDSEGSDFSPPVHRR